MIKRSIISTVLFFSALVTFSTLVTYSSTAIAAPASDATVRIRFSGSSAALTTTQRNTLRGFLRKMRPSDRISIESPCRNGQVGPREIARATAVRSWFQTAQVSAGRIKEVSVCGPQVRDDGIYVTRHRRDERRMRVRWEPPTHNTDGSRLRNLAGHVVVAQRSGFREVNEIVTRSDSLDDISFFLEPGTYRVSVVAYTRGSRSLESRPSRRVSATVRR